MRCNLYYNRSDDRVVNKVITKIGENIDIFFKDDTDIVHPTLKVSSENYNIEANYIYIADLDRYYYIKSKTYSRQCIYLECDVDVLMSFKSELLSQDVILKRQSNKYNLYQNDDEFKLLQFEAIRTQEFPSGFNADTQEFILGVVGNVEEINNVS